MNHLLDWIQNWFFKQCNGDWEHQYGITIETVDNPGWYIVINLNDTICQNRDFTMIEMDNGEMDWYFCLTKNNNFEASCSPKHLNTVLKHFKNWAEEVERST